MMIMDKNQNLLKIVKMKVNKMKLKMKNKVNWILKMKAMKAIENYTLFISLISYIIFIISLNVLNK
jgi:hypothetical protein